MTNEILVDRQAIAARVKELAAAIAASTVADAEHPLLLVCILNGAIPFAADLLRAFPEDFSVELDSIGVSSYVRDSSSGALHFRSGLKHKVGNANILLVDDILDSGTTLAALRQELLAEGAETVRVCVLLDKQRERRADALAKADFTGFTIPDRFVVGCGLDYDERFRNYPDIRVFSGK